MLPLGAIEWPNTTSVFLFQAEVGIRDLTVTGVQTCALPIFPRRQGPWIDAARAAGATSDRREHYRSRDAERHPVVVLPDVRRRAHRISLGACRSGRRSEERRVGKECRSR